MAKDKNKGNKANKAQADKMEKARKARKSASQKIAEAIKAFGESMDGAKKLLSAVKKNCATLEIDWRQWLTWAYLDNKPQGAGAGVSKQARRLSEALGGDEGAELMRLLAKAKGAAKAAGIPLRDTGKGDADE